MVLKPAFLIASLLMGSAAAARPHIYTYVDKDGMRHYTDVPDNNRYRLLTLSPQERTASGDRYDSMLLAKAGRYDSIIETAAHSASLEPDLLRAVIVVESGFNSRAVSKRGAVGLMQLMPATATRFGVSNPFDPRENVHAGARYLKFLMDRFGQDLKLALAAYNAGEQAVDRNGRQIPPFTETMAYVPRVLKIYRMLRDQPRVSDAGLQLARPGRLHGDSRHFEMRAEQQLVDTDEGTRGKLAVKIAAVNRVELVEKS
jgi:soluble lytic murein transglycosylase-like protein